MKKNVGVFLVLGLIVVGFAAYHFTRPFKYETIHWWDDAEQSGRQARLIRHLEGGDEPQDVSNAAQMLSVLTEAGWDFVSVSQGNHSRDYLIRTRHPQSGEYWTVQTRKLQ